MTEMPDASMLMSMVRDARAGFVDPKWDELLALVNDQANAIQRVQDLHTEMNNNFNACQECLLNYPCPTIKALDGDDA